MRLDAEREGRYTIRIEAPENRSLPGIFLPQLRQTLLRISRVERAKSLAERGLRALAGFAKALKIKYQDIEVGIDLEPEPGLADNGDLEHDLQTLLSVIGTATKSAGNALVLFVDELLRSRMGETRLGSRNQISDHGLRRSRRDDYCGRSLG